jgi:hypothetical protein
LISYTLLFFKNISIIAIMFDFTVEAVKWDHFGTETN